MHLKTRSKQRRSIREWYEEFRSTANKHIHTLGNFIYNREHHDIFGRDGKRWRLSFRPQASFNLNDVQTLISLSSNDEQSQKESINDNIEIYIKNLDEYLKVYNNTRSSKNFTIHDVGDCNSINHYGYKNGKPCILIKINKLIGFIPEIDRTDADNKTESECIGIPNIPVRCMGEYLFDQEMLGDIVYYSESGSSDVCGSIDIKHFPYNGKENRNDVYQAPYVWVQFKTITPYVLISVECRVFAANIFYDKIAQRGSIRFQLYLNKKI
ncbi:unnamed protein product [Rotaria sp. Silwood2]|nr:unnamed protein product [Rotaria sp. Silwood2]